MLYLEKLHSFILTVNINVITILQIMYSPIAFTTTPLWVKFRELRNMELFFWQTYIQIFFIYTNQKVLLFILTDFSFFLIINNVGWWDFWLAQIHVPWSLFFVIFQFHLHFVYVYPNIILDIWPGNQFPKLLTTESKALQRSH